MNTRHLITGGLLATCLLSTKADPFSTTLFYTRYGTDSNPYNVKKVDVSYDGTSWTVGSPVNVGITPGADGIVGDPQNANLVLVGGQGPTVSTVDKNTGFVNTYSSPNVTFHLAVPTPNTLLGSGIPGQLGRVPINNDGSLGSGSVITVDRSITTVIPAPGGNFFFTDAGPGGYGDWGKITFDSGIDTANSATTAVFAGLVASAHGGTYDPYSNSIILFGSNEVSQWSLAGTFMGSRTFGGANFDQGTVDGSGHLFIASNNGDVLLMDYDATGQVFNLSNPFYHQFLDTYLDDIAPLIGEGGTSTVPEPSTVIGALALSSLFARRILKRK